MVGSNPESTFRVMPDISHEGEVAAFGTLDKVGMESIEMPVLVADSQGNLIRQAASIDAFVSLDQPKSKGIHMSRLYSTLNEIMTSEPLNISTLQQVLSRFVECHEGLSHSSYVKVQFSYMVERESLKSGLRGWREYPVIFEGINLNGEFRFTLGGEVMYSSTCPCSAALARQLVQENFMGSFAGSQSVSVDEVKAWLGKEESVLATPHAQRSLARFKVRFESQSQVPDVLALIDRVESCLATPVQAAVKRQDEQEFALLNGQNLMFCEDAARKIKGDFEKDPIIADYYIKVEHLESLHPHNAVSVVTKGVENGFVPI